MPPSRAGFEASITAVFARDAFDLHSQYARNRRRCGSSRGRAFISGALDWGALPGLALRRLILRRLVLSGQQHRQRGHHPRNHPMESSPHKHHYGTTTVSRGSSRTFWSGLLPLITSL